MSKLLAAFVFLLIAGAAAVVGMRLANSSSDAPPLRDIPAGNARLGSREPGGLPHHETDLPSFRIGAREITAGEFAAFRNEEPWKSMPPRFPASRVSIDDAIAYCDWLSRKIHAPVRLPTEDEWEYAARGGVRGAPFPWGWDPADGRANFRAASACPVASFPANAFGVFDAAGNVAEWCMLKSPSAAVAVARGGNFADREAGRLNVFRRAEFPRGYRDADVGFRILVDASQSK